MKLQRHSWLSEESMKDHCCTQWNLIFGFNMRSQSMFCKQCISRIAGVNISATYNFTAKRCQTGQETTYCLSNKIKTEWILVSFNKKCTPWYNVGRVWQWHLFKDEGFSTEQINIPKNMLTALHVPWLSHIECPKAEANIQKIDQASSITSPSATPGNMLAFYLDLPHCQHWQWGLPLEVSQTSQNL